MLQGEPLPTYENPLLPGQVTLGYALHSLPDLLSCTEPQLLLWFQCPYPKFLLTLSCQHSSVGT
jgi:hypothetical protein